MPFFSVIMNLDFFLSYCFKNHENNDCFEWWNDNDVKKVIQLWFLTGDIRLICWYLIHSCCYAKMCCVGDVSRANWSWYFIALLDRCLCLGIDWLTVTLLLFYDCQNFFLLGSKPWCCFCFRYCDRNVLNCGLSDWPMLL